MSRPMLRGSHMRVMGWLLIPCSLVALLASCGALKTLPSDSELAGSDSSTQARVEALSAALAQEQQRNATLAELFDQRGQELEQIRVDVERLGERETELRTALEQALGVAGEGTAPALAAEAAEGAAPASAPPPEGSAAAGGGTRSPSGDAALRDTVNSSLRVALFREQRRRQDTEMQLSRLKEETSAPPYAQGSTPDADLAAAKREIAGLKSALADERATREHLAQEFRSLQERSAQAPQDGGPENPDSQSQLEELRAQKAALEDSFNRGLAASQRQTADLERKLATTHGAAVGGDVTAVIAENTALRERLDDEHRRTQQLAAKLRLAIRVTDLIFKMQAQPPRVPAR